MSATASCHGAAVWFEVSSGAQEAFLQHVQGRVIAQCIKLQAVLGELAMT